MKIAVFLLASLPVILAAPALEAYNVEEGSLTVSGISAGAAFASQFHVAYSSLVKGLASFAGIPYYCAKGLLYTALYTCMTDFNVNVDSLITKARDYSSSGDIDATANLAGSKVFLWHGTRDNTVKPGNSDNMKEFYEAFGAEVKSMMTMESGHGQPTLDYGVICSLTASPFINKCDYDGAFEALNYLYGGALNRPSGGAPSGDFLDYNQEEFDSTLFGNSWDTDGGFIYVPEICQSREYACKLHVAFHGCQQGRSFIDDKYARYSGYLEVADANAMIILFPQIKRNLLNNPNGCFDWWGYDGLSYARKDGPQMETVLGMVERVMEGSNGGPLPPTTLPPCREL